MQMQYNSNLLQKDKINNSGVSGHDISAFMELATHLLLIISLSVGLGGPKNSSLLSPLKRKIKNRKHLLFLLGKK